jgi:hypothetical protein
MRVTAVGTFELDFISLGEVGHGALQFGEDGARGEGTGGKNTELRFACAMRIPLGVSYLDRATCEVEFHVAGRMGRKRVYFSLSETFGEVTNGRQLDETVDSIMDGSDRRTFG